MPYKPLSERKTLAQFPLKNWRLETENFINAIVSLYQQVPEIPGDSWSTYSEVFQCHYRRQRCWSFLEENTIYKVICKLDSEVPEIFNPQTAYKSCFMSRNFNNSFFECMNSSSPFGYALSVSRFWFHICVWRHGYVMKSAGNSLLHHLSLIFFCFQLQGWFFSCRLWLLLPKALNIWKLK